MKRASKTAKLYVGGFVVAVVTLGALALLFAGDSLMMFKHRSHYQAAFKDVSGLQIGAPVKMGGVDVGMVEDIQLTVQDGATEILAKLTVYEPFDKLVKTDSEVLLETQGMLGDRFVMLTSGSPGAQALEQNGLLRTKDRVEISSVVKQSALLVEELSKSASQINTILRTMHSITKKVNDGQGTLGALVNDPSLYDDVRAVMGRANRSKVARVMLQRTVEAAGEEQESLIAH